MRITGQTAQDLSGYARDISGGRVALCNVGADIGHGARVIDGNRQIVWLGKPRHAAAYYLGQIDAFADRDLLAADAMPLHVQRARRELLDDDRRPDMLSWYDQGRADGLSRAER